MVKQKIGVVANHKTINYGTMLQALATQRALERLGFTVETINLEGIEGDIKSRKMHYFRTQMSKKDLLESKLPYLKKQIRAKLNHGFAEQLRKREMVFRAFREEQFPMSEICKDREELSRLSRKYDTVLVGSDQIWLPSNIAADVFTLNFVPEEINKVAYASSFGVSNLPQIQEKVAGAFLNRINHVSVRELSGQRIVEAMAKREVPVVCDPTMLFTGEEWMRIIPKMKVRKEPYIFCYFLGNNPEQREWASQVREKTGLQIVAPLHMDEYIKSDVRFPDLSPFDMGPKEFLNYIREAEYVITDSFHGTVLSVLNGKRVFTFDRFRKNAAVSTNTRIDSLYMLLGIPERHINADANVDECIAMPAEYDAAWARIDSLRKDSWKYLKTALGVE